MKAAELARKAAVAELYPALEVSAAGAVVFPVFRSGRIRADVDQADAALSQRKAELDDLRGRAEQEVRNATLDLNATTQQVRVTDSNRGLAADTLTQARDRFRSGVTDTIEVVQAQEALAASESDYITSLFAWNLARVSMARAIGQAEQGISRIVGGK